MLGFFQTISRRINFVEGVMLAVILTLINLAIFHDILTRYVGTPAIVPGCEEIARFGLVWFTFLGASFAYKKKGASSHWYSCDQTSQEYSKNCQTYRHVGYCIFSIDPDFLWIQICT